VWTVCGVLVESVTVTCRGRESVVEAIKSVFKGPERGRKSVVEAIKSVVQGPIEVVRVW
jgi:hypothetical protein